MSDILPSPSHAHRTGRLRAALLLALLALVLVTAALLSYLSPRGTGQRIGVGDTLTLAKDRRVLSATMRDEDALVVGEAKPGRGLVPGGGRFSAELPANGELTASLTALLAATGAQVRVDHQDGKDRARLLLTTLIPVLALTDLVWLVMLSSLNARTTGAGWPAGPWTAGSETTGEVVVMSSNPVLTRADPSSELVSAPVAKTQGRRASTGRHLRTRTSPGQEAADEGEPPPKARKAAPRKAVPDPSAGTSGRAAPGRTKATGAGATGAGASKATRAGGSTGRGGSTGAPARKATPTGGTAGRGSTGRGSRASSAPTDAAAATDAAFGSGDVQPSAPAKRARPAQRASDAPPSRRAAPDASPASRAGRAAPDVAPSPSSRARRTAPDVSPSPSSRARRAARDVSPAPDTAVAPRKRPSRRTES